MVYSQRDKWTCRFPVAELPYPVTANTTNAPIQVSSKSMAVAKNHLFGRGGFGAG